MVFNRFDKEGRSSLLGTVRKGAVREAAGVPSHVRRPKASGRRQVQGPTLHIRKLARYLRSFPSLGLMFRKGGGKLIGYLDSNYAIDKANRVSILRSIFFLYRLPVS